MADETKLTAATRIEKLLDNIAGGDNDVTPATRLEKFLSYIADAMEGGGSGGGEDVNYVKVLNATTVETEDQASAPIFVYDEQNGWVNIRESGFTLILITEEDIPDAFVIKPNNIGVVNYPAATYELEYVTGITHTPDVTDTPGFYVEYADQYYAFVDRFTSQVVVKNGVVNYHSGLV